LKIKEEAMYPKKKKKKPKQKRKTKLIKNKKK
jgi:hypothetical protein